MEREEILKKVKAIIAIKTDDDEFNEESNLKEDLGYDSLDEIELIMEAEKEFGIFIQDDLAASIKTIGDAVNLIERILTPPTAA